MANLLLFITRSFFKLCSFSLSILFLISCSSFPSTEAYDPLDPNGNITIKWDIMSWTSDGYVAVVTIYNFQQYRHIQAPGWKLGWTWAKKEVIWSMMGGETTEQGDCSRFKGGVLNSWTQDPATAASSFQLSVGQSGTTNKTVRVPVNFTLKAPGPGYTCGPAKIVKPSRFVTPDGRRETQAMMTWNVTCTYSQFLAQEAPSCCVSFSSFYNDTIVPCSKCACGCQNTSQPGSCVESKASHIAPVVNSYTPLVRCTSHMCPWSLVVQHPNFDNLTQSFSFNYKSITPYTAINDTAMLWGIKFYNDMLLEAGPLGNVQSELLFRKDKATFTFEEGWAFPRRIYFNGDNCVMPTPNVYPGLPNASSHQLTSALGLLVTLLAAMALLFGHA
ncbi:hypothetical protein V6Z12_D11G177800 [Gossypium hirsutum]